jgi:hypothetical protein
MEDKYRIKPCQEVVASGPPRMSGGAGGFAHAGVLSMLFWQTSSSMTVFYEQLIGKNLLAIC